MLLNSLRENDCCANIWELDVLWMRYNPVPLEVNHFFNSMFTNKNKFDILHKAWFLFSFEQENNSPLRFVFNPLSVNPTKWSNTLKQFIGNCWRKKI